MQLASLCEMQSSQPRVNLVKSSPRPLLQLPKRRINTISQILSHQRNASSTIPAAISTTAPPTSLTFATNHEEMRIFQSANLLVRTGSNWSPLSCQKSLKEVTVGFLGLITESSRETALLLKNGFGMNVIYQQRHPVLAPHMFPFFHLSISLH